MSRVRNGDRQSVKTVAHMARKGKRHTALVSVAFALFWIPVIIFAAIADEVHEREPIPFDVTTLTWAYEHHTPVLDGFFLTVTALGGPLAVTGLGMALLGVFVYVRRYRIAGAIIAGVGGAALANVVLKLIFARIRPDVFPALVRESGYSFPSGHAMVSSALVFTLIFAAWRTRWRIPAVIAGIGATLLVGMSRVYIGVHYPSDVIAGWAVGAVWAILACSLVLDFPFKLHIYISRFLKRPA